MLELGFKRSNNDWCLDLRDQRMIGAIIVKLKRIQNYILLIGSTSIRKLDEIIKILFNFLNEIPQN